MSQYASRLIAQAKAEGWKRLHLGRTQLRGTVPSEIWELDELEELILGDFWEEPVGWRFHNTMSPNTMPHGHQSGISAFPPPPAAVIDGASGGLQRLRLLSMQRVELDDYAFLGYLPRLTSLDLNIVFYHMEASEVAPDILSYLKSPLTHLHACMCGGINLSILAAQKELEVLRIDGKYVSKDLLSQFKKLRHLALCGYPPEFDLADLPDLPALEVLGDGFKVSGSGMLRWLPQLKSFVYQLAHPLSAEDLLQHSLALRSAVHLEHLSIGEAGTFDLADLSGCTRLDSLEIRCYRLENIGVLRTFQKLRSVDLQIGYQRYDPTQDEKGEPTRSNTGKLLKAQQQCAEMLDAISGLTQLTSLRLSGFPLQRLSQFSELVNLESLSLFGSQLSSLNGIGAFPALHSLHLYDATLIDISAIAACQELTSFDLYDAPLVSLAGIGSCAKLTRVSLSHCQVADVQPLSQLAHLEDIRFEHLPLMDLSPLRNCLDLKTVSLWMMPLSDIAPLGSLPKLTRLELQEVAVKDYSPLEPWFRKWVFAKLPEDERGSFLALDFQEVRKNPPSTYIGFLRAIDALNYWDMLRWQAGETEFPWRHGVPLPEDNLAATLEYLREAKAQGLTRIDLYPFKIIGSVPIEIWDHPHIRELNFAKSGWHWWKQENFDNQAGGHAISHFPPPPLGRQEGEQAGLPLLRLLNISDTQIAQMDFLRWMPNLMVLELRGTEVTDLTAVAGLTRLHALDIRDTSISDLGPLRGLTSLRHVYLDGSQVSDLSPLKDCADLKTLSYTNTPAERREKGTNGEE